MSGLFISSVMAAEENKSQSEASAWRSLDDTYFGFSTGMGRYRQDFTNVAGNKTTSGSSLDLNSIKFGVFGPEDRRYELSYSRFAFEYQNTPGRMYKVDGFDLDVLFPLRRNQFELIGNPVKPYVGVGGGYYSYEVVERKGYAINFAAGLVMPIERSFELELAFRPKLIRWEEKSGTSLQDRNYSFNLGFIIRN